MRMRRAAAIAVSLAALTSTVGCTTTAGTARKAPGAGPADPARVHSLVLSADELPAGYEVMEITADDLRETTGAILDGRRSAKISPSSCMQVSAIPSDIDFSSIGLRIATAQTATLAETVTVQDQDLDVLRTRVSGECATMTVELTEGPGAGTRSEVTSSVVDSPVTDGRDALVIEQTTSASVRGRRVTRTSLTGYALINGYTVSMQVSDSVGGHLEPSTFDDAFAAAMEKVEKQTG